MAKSTALAHRFGHRPAAPVIVVHSPSRGRVRRGARAVGRVARAGARRAAPHLKRSLPVIGLALGGAAIGYAESKGYLDKLPAVGGSRALPIAALGWGITRFAKNPTIRMAGIAMIVAGAFDFGRTQGAGKSGTHGIFGVPEDGGAGRGGGF